MKNFEERMFGSNSGEKNSSNINLSKLSNTSGNSMSILNIAKEKAKQEPSNREKNNISQSGSLGVNTAKTTAKTKEKEKKEETNSFNQAGKTESSEETNSFNQAGKTESSADRTNNNGKKPKLEQRSDSNKGKESDCLIF